MRRKTLRRRLRQTSRRRRHGKRHGGSQNRSLMTPEQELQYERERIMSLMQAITNAHGSINKAKKAEDLFEFLLTTRYILNNERLRDTLIERIQNFEMQPHISPRLYNLLQAAKEHIATFPRA
jgi:hypothetical protein